MINIVISIFLIFLILSTCNGCSVSCNSSQEFRVCVDNAQGWIAADCSGFVGCVHVTQPCGGECPRQYPVISEDGLQCGACYELANDGEPVQVCPQCAE